MVSEHQEIYSFLKKYPPFRTLPDDALQSLVGTVEVSYFRSGKQILALNQPINDLYVVRSGSVEVFQRNGELFNRMSEGGIFGQMGLLMKRQVRYPIKAIEDTLLYCIPADLFDEYCAQFDQFGDFFELLDSEVLRQAVSEQDKSNDFTTIKARTLLTREVVSVCQTTSILAAAQVMSKEGISSLLITSNSADDVVGILTDMDMRQRVVASGIDTSEDVGAVMSTDFVTIDHNAYVFEAMLTMLRDNLQHLPILNGRKALGVLSLSDIVRYESQSSLLLVKGIFAQQSIGDLAEYSQQLPSVFVRMVNEDANSHMIGSAMAVIGRSFKQRLLALAEEQLGPPPVPYCFLALGSMARDEQLIVTDQDNAIILDDRYSEADHGGYFEQLAGIVCNGLAACGYTLCSGDIMATNPQWRLTQSQWREQFSQWIEKPDPKALLNSSIFFDLDGVWGETTWAQELREYIAEQARKSPLFLASLARNALNRTPPLGFFKGFVMEQDGRHRNSINLKRRGTAPLSDVIRVHALAVGSTSLNSFERLEDIEATDLLPAGKAQELSDALEYISMVRIRYQARDLETAQEPDNNIEPASLSNFERRNLKEAFQVLDNAQSFLKFRYRANSAWKQ